MYLNGTDPSNPIFLVNANGNYLRDEEGTYVLFAGDAHPEPGGTALMSATGYYLVDTNGNYLSAPSSDASLLRTPVPGTSFDSLRAAAAAAQEPQASAPASDSSAGATAVMPPAIAPASAAAQQPSAPSAATLAPGGLAPAAGQQMPAQQIPATQMPAAQVPGTQIGYQQMPQFGQALPASIQPASNRRRLALPDTDLRSDQEKKSDRRGTAIVILALLLLAALAALGAIFIKTSLFSSDLAPVESAPQSETTEAPKQEPAPIQTAGEVPTPSESPTTAEPTQLPVPAGVYPGAGRAAAPENASTLPASNGIAYVTTPSGNITCAFRGDDLAECYVNSWVQDQPYGKTTGEHGEFPNAKVVFSTEGTATVGPVTDAMSPGTVLSYNSAGVSGKWACGSAENGLTCWNTETGHGAFINRDGYQAF